MKCPTCHEDYATQAGFQAHVPNCGYKDNPLPAPPVLDLNKPLDKMSKAELLAFSELNGIVVVEEATKAKLIEDIIEMQELREIAKLSTIEGFDKMNKAQLIAAIEEAENGKK